jgi:hypothetical protein
MHASSAEVSLRADHAGGKLQGQLLMEVVIVASQLCSLGGMGLMVKKWRTMLVRPTPKLN